MTIVLSAYVVAQALELLSWQRGLWPYRSFTAPLAFGSAILTATWALLYGPSIFTLVLAAIAFYRAINFVRVMFGRMQSDYLRRSTWRTEFWLTIYTAACFGLWWFFHSISVNVAEFWIIMMVLQFLLSLMLLVTTLKHARSMHPPIITNWQADKDLPTLTVAVPARNETEDLQNCLRTLTASDYPKLEIIVLDDCSTLRRTPEIIRQFAHDGVRFIKGRQPTDDGWLPKNLAYQRLLEEANGEYVLFCGADVRFEPQTLRHIVTLMLEKNKSMMSIMPRNILPRFLQLDASLIQPMRYAWEVALPRKLFRRPPVLSTCWIAKHEVLLSSGGFSAVSRSIVPESYFARQCVLHDGYGFRYSSALMGLTSHKDVRDQRDTATRTKYPQLHRRPEFVLPLTLIELIGIVMPFIFLAVGIIFYPELMTVLIISGATSFTLLVWFMVVCTLTYRKPDLRSVLSLPFATLLDTALLNYSMLKYEFSVVLWKERDVCVPVMRVDSRLPELKAKTSKA